MNAKLLKALRSFDCLNQKNIIKYNYIISENHKNLKESYNDFLTKKETNISKLDKLLNNFILDSFSELLDILNINKSEIHKIYKALGKDTLPRITVKVIAGDNVTTIFSSSSKNIFQFSKINKNTGFDEIVNKSKPFFIENDIPDRVKKRTYLNPRLNQNKIEKFKNDKIKWKDCWENLSNDNTKIDYYSSTMIIPMSIKGNDEDKENEGFFNHYFKKIDQYKDSRSIWGFLCFDHVNTDYFLNKQNNELYTDIGYIIADSLSLYLIFFYNYVSGSKTIEEIKEFISSNNENNI